MQEDNQTKFGEFIKNRIEEEGLEKPSMNFTNSVISKIDSLKAHSEVMDYKPLISKKIWYSGAVVVIGIFSYLVYGNSTLEFNLLPHVKMQQFNLLERLPNINVSNIYVYAFVGLAFFVGLQIVLLKNHFDKRYFLE